MVHSLVTRLQLTTLGRHVKSLVVLGRHVFSTILITGILVVILMSTTTILFYEMSWGLLTERSVGLLLKKRKCLDWSKDSSTNDSVVRFNERVIV